MFLSGSGRFNTGGFRLEGHLGIQFAYGFNKIVTSKLFFCPVLPSMTSVLKETASDHHTAGCQGDPHFKTGEENISTSTGV
jgi:hypothetical protein